MAYIRKTETGYEFGTVEINSANRKKDRLVPVGELPTYGEAHAALEAHIGHSIPWPKRILPPTRPGGPPSYIEAHL